MNSETSGRSGRSHPLLCVENLLQQQTNGFRLQVPHFEVYPGKSYALTGPNGAGKTTLLKIFALINRPIQGILTFNGQQISSDSLEQSSRRHITMVMQDAYLFHTTVFNNIAYGLKIRDIPERTVRTKVQQALEIVDLGSFGPRKAHQLSRGETQRVAIARALALEPSLLLMDEPTANVDRDNIGIIEHIIIELMRSQGTAVVFSTHQVEQAYRLADEVVSLRDGLMLDAGPTNLFTGEIYHEEQDTFVRLSPGISIYVSTDRQGKIHLRIPPEDIIISKAKLESSARNSFPGTITSANMDGNQIRLGLDIGITLTAVITQQSFNDMTLTIGKKVFVTFKTTAVRLY